MTIQQLEYFLSAARTLNFTKTAKNFFISQSAVTQQIKNLENELQVELFIRGNRKLDLTPAGKIFIKEAEKVLNVTNEAVDRVRAAYNGKTGSLNIGYLKSMEASGLPGIIQKFHHKYPVIRLNLVRDSAVHLHDDYIMGKYDIIFNIVQSSLRYNDTEILPLGSFPYYVIVPADHPLAVRKKIVQSDLKYESLILHDLQKGMRMEWEVTVRRYLDRDLMNNVIDTEDDVETMLMKIAAGIGVGILPKFDLLNLRMGLDLKYIPLDTGDFKASLSMYYEKDNIRNPLVSYFVQEVRDALAKKEEKENQISNQ